MPQEVNRALDLGAGVQNLTAVTGSNHSAKSLFYEGCRLVGLEFGPFTIKLEPFLLGIEVAHHFRVVQGGDEIRREAQALFYVVILVGILFGVTQVGADQVRNFPIEKLGEQCG